MINLGINVSLIDVLPEKGAEKSRNSIFERLLKWIIQK